MKPKDTQSQAKLRQYIEDLRRNELFMKKLERIKVLTQTEEHEKNAEKEDKGMDKVFKEYVEYENEVRQKRDKLSLEYYRVLESLSEEYGIDFDTIFTIILYDITEQERFIDSLVLDLCAVTDNFDLDLNEEAQTIPVFLDTGRQSHIRAYPVSIDIHRFASKRDVLDYVNKRWDLIEANLKKYREDGKPIRFRERKYSLEIVDYIWENRSKPINELAELVNELFPDSDYTFSYVEVQKIILNERIRRQSSIGK
jgi:hypothetical protein